MSNIRNLAAFRAAVWDWSFLNGSFGNPRIRASDIDGMVEINGHFLMLEGKKGGYVSKGQEILFDRWIRNGHALILMHGMDHAQESMIIVARGGLWPATSTPMAGNANTVRQLCQAWSTWASRSPYHLLLKESQ